MAEEQDLIQSLLELVSGGEENNSSEEETTAPVVGTPVTDGPDFAGMIKMASIFSELGAEDDRSRLLSAIKPFLSEEKRPQVDTALKLLRLIKAAEAAGKLDILKEWKL